jgi:hypothetical protein
VSSFEAVSIRQSTVTEILAASRIRVRRGSQVETLACTMGRSKLKRRASSVAPVGAVPGCLRLAPRNVTLDLPRGGVVVQQPQFMRMQTWWSQHFGLRLSNLRWSGP